MPGLTVDILLQDIKKLETEACAVSFFEDIRPLKGRAGEFDWLLCGTLSNLIISHKLIGSVGDVALLTSQGKLSIQKIFLVGLGRSETISASSVAESAKIATESAVRTGVKNLVMDFFSVPGMPIEKILTAQLQGIRDGCREKDISITILAPDTSAYDKLLKLVHSQ